MNTRFKAPLVIFAGTPTKAFLISSTEDASAFLFEQWDKNDSEEWLEAMNQCDLVGHGLGSIEVAKSSFLNALRSAAIRVDPAFELY